MRSLIPLLLVFATVTVSLAQSSACYGQIDVDIVEGRGTIEYMIQAILPQETAELLKSSDSAQLASIMKVFVRSQVADANRQSMLGKCRLNDRALLFEPRFPLRPGIVYVVEITLPKSEKPESYEVFLPKPIMAATTVVREVYPTSEVLPQNLLKFYVHFSSPMSQGDAYEHIELTTASGEKLFHPFLEIEEELWDRTGERLTLLLDPGRVKRGLIPREEDGPIFVPGKEYKLTIRSDWCDANGTPLKQEFVKRFTIGPEDFAQPDPASWIVRAPKARTSEPLIIECPEPLDEATASRGIMIYGPGEELIRGSIQFQNREKQVRFFPIKKWRAGIVEIRIGTFIEDLAGNSIERAFEVDRFEKVDRVELTPPKFKTRAVEIRE